MSIYLSDYINSFTFADAYYTNIRCIREDCMRYIGLPETYEDAELACSMQYDGGCVAHIDKTPGNRWNSWLDFQLKTDTQNRGEMWIGAKLHNLRCKY